MKIRRILFIMMLVLVTASTAWAGVPLIYRLNMGIANPLTPETFKKSHLSGFNLGAALGTRIGSRHELSADVSYNNFSLNVQGYLSALEISDADKAESSATGGTAHVTTLFLNWKSRFPAPGEDRFIPYLFAETGLFHFQQEQLQYWGPIGKDATQSAASSTVKGMGAGIGMNIAIEDETYLFVDIGFKIGFTEAQRTAFYPIRVGVSFNQVL